MAIETFSVDDTLDDAEVYGQFTNREDGTNGNGLVSNGKYKSNHSSSEPSYDYLITTNSIGTVFSYQVEFKINTTGPIYQVCGVILGTSLPAGEFDPDDYNACLMNVWIDETDQDWKLEVSRNSRNGYSGYMTWNFDTHAWDETLPYWSGLNPNNTYRITITRDAANTTIEIYDVTGDVLIETIVSANSDMLPITDNAYFYFGVPSGWVLGSPSEVYWDNAGLVETGVDLIKVINEVVNVGESQNRLLGRIKIHNEAVNIAESSNYTRGRSRVINEFLNIGELKNYKRTLLRIINETLHISELKNKLMVLIRVKNEIINIGESTVKIIGGIIVKVINEVMNISETKNKLMTRLRVINESINISELKNKISGIIRIKNEVINIAETKNYIRGRIRVINEVINISEVKNKLRVLIRIKNEIINIGETKNKLMTLLRIKNETMNITELKNTAKGIIRIINETIHITENIVKKIWIIIIQFPRNLKRIIILIRDRK